MYYCIVLYFAESSVPSAAHELAIAVSEPHKTQKMQRAVGRRIGREQVRVLEFEETRFESSDLLRESGRTLRCNTTIMFATIPYCTEYIMYVYSISLNPEDLECRILRGS